MREQKTIINEVKQLWHKAFFHSSTKFIKVTQA